jgi:hypothetical protein
MGSRENVCSYKVSGTISRRHEAESKVFDKKRRCTQRPRSHTRRRNRTMGETRRRSDADG